jgi:integrase
MAEQRERNDEQPGKEPRRQRRRRSHGEGSVFELKGRDRNRKKPWVAQITLENGRKKQTYHATQQEAIAARRKMLNELELGILATGPHQLLKDYLEYWLEDVHKPAIKLTSYLRYRVLLNKHLLPDLGHIQLTKLTVRHVQSFYAKKLEEGLSASTVRMLHAILHRALADAVRSTLVGRNVCDQVTLPRPRKPETRTLSVEQARQLVETVQGHRLEALFLMALTTGMRRGELLALRWQDIGFEHNSIYIHRTVSYYAKRGFLISEPKTAGSRRKLAIPPFLTDVLSRHQADQEKARASARGSWKDNGLVFCNVHGGFIHPVTLVWTFHDLLQKAGLERIRFHDLRHSAATILLTMGVHPKVVQELLGHSTIRVTMDTYSHVLPSIQAEAIEKLGGLFQQQHKGHETINETREKGSPP